MSNGDTTTDDKDLKRVTVDGETVERFTPSEQRESQSFEQGDAAAKQPHFGVRYSKFVPPGTG